MLAHGAGRGFQFKEGGPGRPLGMVAANMPDEKGRGGVSRVGTCGKVPGRGNDPVRKSPSDSSEQEEG